MTAAWQRTEVAHEKREEDEKNCISFLPAAKPAGQWLTIGLLLLLIRQQKPLRDQESMGT